MGTGPTVAPPVGGTLSDSLVAHWAFDEQYGQTAHDKVGNNHGTFGASTSPGSDDPTWTAAGECKVNGCLGFDGGDLVSLPPSLAVTSAYSFSAWINTSNIADNQQIISKDGSSGTSRQWQFRVVTTGQLSLIRFNSSGNIIEEVLSTRTINDGQWHHVAATFDTATGTMLYIDGSIAATSSNTTANGGEINTERPLIGARNSTGPLTFFDGLIDEVKIYNTALTADQVKQDINAGASVAYSVGSEEADELADGAGAPPIAEWKFDEKQGTVAYDSSGNANDGTVNGATWKSGCQQGACLVFDGANDNVLVSSLSPNITGKTLTMNAWIELKNSGIQRAISGSGTSTSFGFNGFNLYVHTRTSLGDDVNTPYISLPTNCQAGWHYFSITWDTTLPSDNVKVYCDATKVGSGSLSNGLNGDFNISSMMIGYNSSDQSIDGQIDHVKIYDYARTPAQIAYDYNRGAPVAHYKFDECEGGTIHDSSENGLHGTWNGTSGGTQTSVGTCSTNGTAWGNGASGKYGASLNFDGTDDYVDASTTLSSIPFSLSAWVKYSGSLVTPGLVSFTDPSGYRRDVYIYNNTMLRIFTFDGTTPRYYVSPSP